MTWPGVELPPDENGFHKLDGEYRDIFTGLPAAILKSFFCNCTTDCSTGKVVSAMHGYVWCVRDLDQQNHGAINKHGYLSVSNTVMMVAIALYTDKLGILY